MNSSYRAVITDFGSARVLHKRLDGDYEQDEVASAVGGTIPTAEECATASQLQVSATGEQLTLTGLLGLFGGPLQRSCSESVQTYRGIFGLSGGSFGR